MRPAYADVQQIRANEELASRIAGRHATCHFLAGAVEAGRPIVLTRSATTAAIEDGRRFLTSERSDLVPTIS